MYIQEENSEYTPSNCKTANNLQLAQSLLRNTTKHITLTSSLSHIIIASFAQQVIL